MSPSHRESLETIETGVEQGLASNMDVHARRVGLRGLRKVKSC